MQGVTFVPSLSSLGRLGGWLHLPLGFPTLGLGEGGACTSGRQPSWALPWFSYRPAVCLKLLHPSGPQFPLLQTRDCSRRSAGLKHLSVQKRQTQASPPKGSTASGNFKQMPSSGRLPRAFSFQQIIPQCWADGQFLRNRL